jgi:hypothetical protein
LWVSAGCIAIASLVALMIPEQMVLEAPDKI